MGIARGCRKSYTNVVSFVIIRNIENWSCIYHGFFLDSRENNVADVDKY
jgi:hypothetical protein